MAGYVTGASIIAMKYNEGVLMMTDTKCKSETLKSNLFKILSIKFYFLFYFYLFFLFLPYHRIR